ncbi:MAG: saccharopine dehydrogenase NADP-binding domain-containing protein [Mycoplasmataceae bacterium]|nr:saccharopine dehydrogenase NADP-binding domain-containing protein [Mycoplasmataceae bacterium]
MLKNILILGLGGQGYCAAKYLGSKNIGKKIYCLDLDAKVLNKLENDYKNFICQRLDCSKEEKIIAYAKNKKIDLLINCLPTNLTKICLEVALKSKCNYQDFAIGDGMKNGGTWVDEAKLYVEHYSDLFKKNNKLALIGTGVAPGLMCILTRLAARKLDTIHTIYNFFYEGVDTKTFIPFWFNPDTALTDMIDDPVVFSNGKFIFPEPFSNPTYRKYEYFSHEIAFVEHRHEEAIIYGINAKKYYPGLKRAHFKYAGTNIDFCKQLYRAGLLTKTPIKYNNTSIIPVNFVRTKTTPPPKLEQDIKKIISHGFNSDEVFSFVEVYGVKNNKKYISEFHIFAPGLKKAFELKKLSSEQFLTGQSGAIFSEMMIKEEIKNNGCIFSDELSLEEINVYMNKIKKCGIKFMERLTSTNNINPENI